MHILHELQDLSKAKKRNHPLPRSPAPKVKHGKSKNPLRDGLNIRTDAKA